MATLAQTVSATPPNPESDLWTISADLDDGIDYLQVESEIVRVVGNFPAQYQAPTNTTTSPKIRVERAAGGTTAASHADGTTLTPVIPPSAGGDAAEAGVNIDNTVDPPFLADTFTAPGVYDAGGGVAGWDGVLPTIDQKGAMDNANAPTAENFFATTDDLAALPGLPTLATVLLGSAPPETPGAADGNDTGGVPIIHIPAVDVDADTGLNAVATGTGNANTRPLAQVEDGIAIAGPRAEATGDGNTDACTYARSVDGAALADNDAAASGTGIADAGCYAVAVDGPTPEAMAAFAGAVATASGDGRASVAGEATTTTGVALAGSLAVRGAAKAGMESIVDGTSARMAFNGTTPIAIPVIPATPTAAQIADVLVALGLATQGV